MRRLTVGILAHVDAGKTTLSEALLYRGGALRSLGRVDHADAFLDTEDLERERGITIFSKQAVLSLEDLELTLLDTPGHVDFSAEAERTLQVLDCAILVVSGPDGPQGHTLTLWRLLEKHRVPVFLFLNKMDQPVDKDALLEKLRAVLSREILDFSEHGRDSFWEQAALGDEAALNEYLEGGGLSDGTLARLVGERKLFPCLFGSALRAQGAGELLEAIRCFAPSPSWGEAFAARVFKISRDSQGVRLTHMKITGGCLRVKDVVDLPGGGEKVDQIRVYSGARFTPVSEAPAGTVCAVTGLLSTFPGQGIGAQGPAATHPELEPALVYRLILPEVVQTNAVLPKLRQLAEEDPQLHLEWKEAIGEIHLRLMGKVQAEILKRVILDRFGLEVGFGPGNVVYKETIAAPVEGVGHFEPLRHYAEVHLLLEPLPRGSGLEFASACPEDDLARSWQRLILTHLEEKTHRGVLTGSAITDMRIILLAGRAHEKHTEGGDFRQATYRAVRQGLRKARSILLEPWYSLRLELPSPNLGRVLTDIQRMGGEADTPQTVGEETVLNAAVPVAAFGDYAGELAAYTKGRGRVACTLEGYRPCGDQEEVVTRLGYDPDQDVEDPTGSVFCAHGAGFLVPWDQVEAYMHLPAYPIPTEEEDPVPFAGAGRSGSAPPNPSKGTLEQDAELLAIFERTYGAVTYRDFQPKAPKKPAESLGGRVAVPPPDSGPEYLLVDGYNMIFAWEDLNAIAREDLEAARLALMDILSNYQGYRQNRVILVFDAYKVPKGTGSVFRYHNIYVVYTKEAETADAYIEKTSYQLTREKRRVRVATADFAEQLIILGHGSLRISSRELRAEVEQAEGEIAAILRERRMALRGATLGDVLRKAEKRKKRRGD
ncbi:GTP-binding protein [Acutalibacter sp. 1XD8-33]|uniref:translation factor GTPase family protein n=1 Tax=Acutalibacter sp. 1XD8-33 TaxID=2320081 RepID=UPI000EA131F7|nr:TetM/TetW/TetO/TetS family tetracycline resistance ribosomal protection protein [Acutalibacter sp. 1XD8-33]RKJ42163.1 GTP-binding protein [Acutalibacter sp. 1XD8-33]